MITLELTPREIEELEQLEEGCSIEAEYHGLPCFITYTGEIGDMKIGDRNYVLGFFNPTEWRVKESPIVTVTLHVYFDDESYQMTKFRVYKCHVQSALKKCLRDNFPEWKSYRYTVTDQKGRIVK